MFKRTLTVFTALAAGALLAGCGAPAATHTAAAPKATAPAAAVPSTGAKTVLYRTALPMATVVQNLQAALKAAGWSVPQQFDVKTHLAANKVTVPPSYMMEVLPNQAAGKAIAADPAAGLAFPFRVYLYQQKGATYASYITPSSILGNYHQASLASLAQGLDTQLGTMVAKASQGTKVQAPASDTPGQVLDKQTAVSGLSVTTAVANLAKEVANHGWGVNNKQDFQTVLKAPTGYEVEAFNGALAGQLMNADLPAGIEVPLRFYFYQQGGKLYMAYLEPSSIFARYNNAVATKLGQQLNGTVSNIVVPVMSGVKPAAASNLGAGCG